MTSPQISKVHPDTYFSIYTDIDAEKLDNGLEQVRVILGPEDASGFSDNFIKNALWDNWFDVERTVDYLLGISSGISSFMVLNSMAEEHARQLLAEERKGELYKPSLFPFFPRPPSSILSLLYCPRFCGMLRGM
jgi:hypothetical protein